MIHTIHLVLMIIWHTVKSDWINNDRKIWPKKTFENLPKLNDTVNKWRKSVLKPFKAVTLKEYRKLPWEQVGHPSMI